jgi:MHS family proline/betaine transporter-like MFS transporter
VRAKAPTALPDWRSGYSAFAHLADNDKGRNHVTSAAQGRDNSWPVGRRQMVTAIAASTLGWALDLFDLFILLYVAPVIGKLFFPPDYPTLSLAAVYASFAVTPRPFGSALFGSWADRYGRRGAMIAAVIGVGVGVATALFGALQLSLIRRPDALFCVRNPT